MKRLPMLCLLILGAGLVAAQAQEQAPAPEPSPAQANTTPTAPVPTAPPQSNEDYLPSEEISDDLSVSFPVDI